MNDSNLHEVSRLGADRAPRPVEGKARRTLPGRALALGLLGGALTLGACGAASHSATVEPAHRAPSAVGRRSRVQPSGSSRAGSSSNPIKLVYWAGHASGALHQAVIAEVDHFNATHPGIHVSFIDKGASKSGLAAFEAGQAPNVAMISSYALGPMVNAGAVLNLKPYIDGPDGLSASELHSWYYPVVWDDMQTGGSSQYLFPLEKKSVQVLYFNADLLRRAKIAAPPRTWDEVTTDLAKLTALGPTFHGMAWTPSVRQFLDIARADGSPVFTTKTDRRTFDLDNAGGVEAMEMLRSWVQHGYMIVTSGYDYQTDFGAGKIGLLVDASAGYTYDAGSAGGKFPMGGAPAPAGSSGHSSQYINGASIVMMNVGSKADKAASWTFVKYMGSPSTNTYWDEHTNYLPLGPDTYSMMKSFYAKHPALAATFSNPATWWYKPQTGFAAVDYEAAKPTLLADILDAITGRMSISAALKNMDVEGTKYLKGILRA